MSAKKHGQEAAFRFPDDQKIEYLRDIADPRWYTVAAMSAFTTSEFRNYYKMFGEIIPPAKSRRSFFLQLVFFWRECADVIDFYAKKYPRDRFFVVRLHPEVAALVCVDVMPDENFDALIWAHQMLDASIVGYATQLTLFTVVQGPSVPFTAGTDLIDAMETNTDRKIWFQTHKKLRAFVPESAVVQAVVPLRHDNFFMVEWKSVSSDTDSA